MRPHWQLSLYPEAGEAGGAFVSECSAAGGGQWEESDPERAVAEANRRARGHLRRYCTANRLVRMGDLTYAGAGCHDPAEVRGDVGHFMRRLRLAAGGERFPYVWVPEWHKTDHGLHLHFALGRFIPVGLIREAWGRGHVWIRRHQDLPVGGNGPRDEARRTAGYLSKYLSKGLGNDIPGLHRYDVARGFQPRRVKLLGGHLAGVLGEASQRMGAQPSKVWVSAAVPDWRGGPAVWAAWA
jgi:hypothetical protein